MVALHSTQNACFENDFESRIKINDENRALIIYLFTFVLTFFYCLHGRQLTDTHMNAHIITEEEESLDESDVEALHGN